MASYTALLDAAGNVRVDMVRRDDGALVLTGRIAFGGEPEDVIDFSKPDSDAYKAWIKGAGTDVLDYRAWLAAGGKLGDAVVVPKVREAYGDDLITALSDAELTAMAGGTLRDQRMLSAQRAPFRATDDLIVRLAAVMKIDPAAWLARVPG